MTWLRRCRMRVAMDAVPLTVVETSEFQKQAKALFSSDEIETLKIFIAYNPTAGVVMRGTGGVRKMRWAIGGKGKRGGARVIYYCPSGALPVFLFGAYAKAAKKDLTKAQRNELRKVVAGIVESYGVEP